MAESPTVGVVSCVAVLFSQTRTYVQPILSTPPQQPTPAESLTSRYTPAQTLALLELRKSDLSQAVLAKLSHGTGRATPEAIAELVEMRLARRRSDMRFELTPTGYFIVLALARSLARQLGVPLDDRRANDKPASFARSIYLSQSTW